MKINKREGDKYKNKTLNITKTNIYHTDKKLWPEEPTNQGLDKVSALISNNNQIKLVEYRFIT